MVDVDTPNIDINLPQEEEIFNPDLLLRSFGISDDYGVGGEQREDTELSDISILQSVLMEQCPEQKPSVIMKNNQMLDTGGQSVSQSPHITIVTQDNFILSQAQHVQPQPQPTVISQNDLRNSFSTNYSPVTLEQRKDYVDSPQELVSIPMATLQNILSQPGGVTVTGSEQNLGLAESLVYGSNNQRKRTQQQMNWRSPGCNSVVFTVPSPLTVSPVYVDQKQQTRAEPEDQQMMSASRPSPQSTPPPLMEACEVRGRKFSSKAGRSRPQTPTSDCESEAGYRDREPHTRLGVSGRNTPVEMKPSLRLEDLVDEDKYNKRKRSTSGGDGRKKDPMKSMLEQLQQNIPHIGNPDQEKVSHAGLLVEGSDYIRSLSSENDTVKGQVEHFKQKIDQLHAEIEAFQEKLPEHGAGSIHRILSKKGKSIPDMFADHVRQRTQEDWRYWVFTSIMGHFVHNFSQEVSNISPAEMEKTAVDWLQERMSMSQLRKDAFRKLAKLCSKTSIMEDPSKLPEEARGFVALSETEKEEKSDPEQRELAF